MGVTRQDFIRTGRYLQMSDAEWEAELAVRKEVVANYMKNDEWGIKLNRLNVGIILTGSLYGRAYLKGSVESFKRLGYWLTLSYDNFINPTWPELNYNEWMPPKDVMENVDCFMLSKYQTWGGVSLPYITQLRLASGIMNQFDIVLCANGDCIMERPEGFAELLRYFTDTNADILSSGPTLPREIGTAAFLVKGRAFQAIFKHMLDHMLPFEEYEKSTQDFGNTEGRLAVACRELGLNVVASPKEPFNEQHHEPGGTWHELTGFRHIHGEHNYAYRYHKIPPHHKYLDQRYMGDEYNAIKAYWEKVEAGDMVAAQEILVNWWAKD